MSSKTIANGILRAVFILAGIVILGYFLYMVRSVIGYIIIAAVVALIGRPVVIFLRKRLKFRNTLAVITVMVLFVGILFGVISLFIPLIAEQGDNLSLLDIQAFEKKLELLYQEASEFFGRSFPPLEEVIVSKDWSLLKGMEMGFIPQFLNSVMGVLSTLSIGLFSVLFISFFFLKDSKLLQNSILVLVPEKQEQGIINSMNKIKELLSRYFVGLLAQLSILFVIYTATLLLVGIENALVIAFLCALFNLIPYLGPIIAAVIMILLTMTSNLGSDFSTVILPDVGWVLLGVMIGQLIDNFFSQPLIFSSSVRSHPLEIFLVILIAGLLFGVVGMILAIPGYTVLKVILKEFLTDNKIVQRLTKNL
ncbi:MAG: AI-2E family transporter [Robiginitalea sp.]